MPSARVAIATIAGISCSSAIDLTKGCRDEGLRLQPISRTSQATREIRLAKYIAEII